MKTNPGTCGMRILLVDESGKPQVRLAIKGGDAMLRYRLGSVNLSRP